MSSPDKTSCIVVFKPETPKAIIDQHMKDIEQIGGIITHVYDSVLKGFAALVHPSDLASVHSLAGNGYVDFVENDGEVSIQGF